MPDTGQRKYPDARDPRRKSLGQSLVEFALVLPIFMFLLLVAVDFGRVFLSNIQINNAAREGASYAATTPTDATGILSHVLQETNAQSQRGEGAVTVAGVECRNAVGTVIACADATGGTGAGNSITVTVAEPFTFFTPFINGFFNNSFRMSASATGIVLGYAASTSGTPPGLCSPPNAQFSVAVDGKKITTDPSASTPNSGVCNISGYNWDWGDGTSDVGTASATSHEYTDNGSYLVTLNVTNQGGESNYFSWISIGTSLPPCTVPTASFTYVQGTGSNSKHFDFTDTSTVTDPVHCPITGWRWDFGETPPASSNAQNPSFTYANGSMHTVKLIVTNSAGDSAVYSHAQ